jgi:hypothetical protein
MIRTMCLESHPSMSVIFLSVSQLPNFFFPELGGVLDFYTEHASHHHHGSKVFLLPEFGPGIWSFWVLRYRVHGVYGS